MIDAPKWYILRVRGAHSPLTLRDELGQRGFEFFLPTAHRAVLRHGKKENVEFSLLLNYVPVRAREQALRDWLIDWYQTHPREVSAVRSLSRSGELGSVLTIPDAQMDMFRRAVQCYDNTIPFINPTSEMLEKGDEVRILDGPFKDMEGILLSQQGKDGGRIVIRLSHILAVPTLEIEPELIEVIRFAPAGRHLYQKLDSFEKKVTEAMDYVEKGLPVPDELRRRAEVFVRRYSHLEIPTRRMRERFERLMEMANTVWNK